MVKNDKRILKEDIKQLDDLIEMYISQKQFEKATLCLEELRKLIEKMKGKKNEKQ